MLLESLQGQLETRYDLHIPYQVTAFVSHDVQVAERLSENCDIGAETVFVQQSTELLEFTLYLDADVLKAASNGLNNNFNCPERLANTGQQVDELDSVCAVVEGVSHAVCLLWHAHHDRQLRPLDLELQAEIDKFILLIQIVGGATGRQNLHRRLFRKVRYLAPIGTALFERYRTANESAAIYCSWLQAEYLNNQNLNGLQQELARFYRLSGSDKFQRIHHGLS